MMIMMMMMIKNFNNDTDNDIDNVDGNNNDIYYKETMKKCYIYIFFFNANLW